MSEIKVNKISPKQTCTQLTLGDSGDTIIVPTGANLNTDAIKNLNSSSIITQTNATTITLGFSGSTIAIASGATQTGFGRTGTVNWDTTAKTTTVTAVSGSGYFVDTTSAGVTVNLPAGIAGDIIAVSDYANTAATNNITISPNGSQKIQGINLNYTISVNGGTVTLVYVDATQGWRPTDAATATAISPQALFTVATGGTITTSGDYKIHTFTSPGTFTVTQAGNGPLTPIGGPNTVSYLVVAGGGGGGGPIGGGGGGGGFREGRDITPSYTASPLVAPTGIPISATAYPITVGAGGAGNTGPCTNSSGSPSIFSTITSTGGGRMSTPGGSGGGGGHQGAGGTGNTPPVSPSQGFPGAMNCQQAPPTPSSGRFSGGGGGGATVAGTQSSCSGYPSTTGPGGNGATTSISGSPTSYSGGGGGGAYVNSGDSGGSGGLGGGGKGAGYNGPAGAAGTTNTGGGGGGGSAGPAGPNGSNGGSGIVVIRYKFK